jgi:hypothetical protein
MAFKTPRRGPVRYNNLMSPFKQPKFLVDLKNRVFVSEKPHQDIIDDNGLDPSAYDNYFKGWVYGPDAKVWVEQMEDLAFRYWDQARVGFKKLVAEDILTPRSKTYAIVNHADRLAGTVADFIGLSQTAFTDARIGKEVMLDILPKLSVGAKFRLRSTMRISANRYLQRNVVGKLVKPVKGHPPKLSIRWDHSMSGAHRRMGAVTQAVDVRILLPI